MSDLRAAIEKVEKAGAGIGRLDPDTSTLCDVEAALVPYIEAVRSLLAAAREAEHEIADYLGVANACEIRAEKAEAALAEERRRREEDAVKAELTGLPVHFVSLLPRGRIFMHPDTPKSGARDPWPPPIPTPEPPR